MSETSQLLEVLSFLLPDQQLHVRQIALQSLPPFSHASAPQRAIFDAKSPSSTERESWLQYLATLSTDEGLSAASQHDALKILINMADTAGRVRQITTCPKWLSWCLDTLKAKDSLLADPLCMLLSNLTQKSDAQLSNALLPHLQDLMNLYITGADKATSNSKHASFDFLASVFANLSTVPSARETFVKCALQDGESALAQLAVFTEHPSVIRRGGTASTLKNVSFNTEVHEDLIAANILPQILLPLCGPEEFPLEESDSFPPEIQLMPDDKKREPDAAVRGIHVDILLLWCGSRSGRDTMRAQNVYRIIQMMHKVEEDEEIKEKAVRLVGFLMRDEAAPGQEEAHIENEEDAVVEV